MMVYEQGLTPCGGSSKAIVKITLWGAGRAIAGRDSVNGTLIRDVCTVIADGSGYWEANLVPTSQIVPENTTYKIERITGCDPIVSYITVPSEGGPYEAFTIEGDPMNSITPSALHSHAGNLELHGGGIEVDFAELATSIPLTGAATSSPQITGLHVIIPDIPRPVDVTARVHVGIPTGGPRDVSIALTTLWDGVPGSQVYGFFVADFTTLPAVGATNRTAIAYLRIPPNTPCTVAACGASITSPYTVTVAGGGLQKSNIRARTV